MGLTLPALPYQLRQKTERIEKYHVRQVLYNENKPTWLMRLWLWLKSKDNDNKKGTV